MLLEFLSHLLSFDLFWIASLIMGNLHWLFALMAFVVIAEKGKRPVWHFLVLIGFLYAFVDILALGGWILAPILIMTVLQLFIGLYFDEKSWFNKNFVKIVAVLYFIFTFVHTFYFTLPEV